MYNRDKTEPVLIVAVNAERVASIATWAPRHAICTRQFVVNERKATAVEVLAVFGTNTVKLQS